LPEISQREARRESPGLQWLNGSPLWEQKKLEITQRAHERNHSLNMVPHPGPFSQRRGTMDVVNDGSYLEPLGYKEYHDQQLLHQQAKKSHKLMSML
jgi:hypothetical protein